MKLLRTVLTKTSNLKPLSFLFIFSHVILLVMMTYSIPKINAQMGAKAFDIQPLGYSVSEATSMVRNLNDEIRNLYLFPQLTLLDVLYPLFLALFLSSFLFRLIKITETKNWSNPILFVLPFVAMGFDYLENICIILMITKYVEISEYIVVLSSAFTVLKGVLTSIAWMSILIYSIKWMKSKE